MARLMQLLVAILALFAGLAFHARNSGAVTLDLYFRRFELPLSLVAVVALIVGAVIGALVMSWRIFLLKREIGRLRRATALATSAPAAAVQPVQHGP